MARSIYSAPVSGVFGTSTALATTLATGDTLNTRKGFKGLQFYCDTAYKFLTTPRIAKLTLYDASADTYIDLTDVVLDNNSSTGANIGGMTTSDILYVGCVDTYLGLDINMSSSVNSATTTFTEEYWDANVGAWTALSGVSDGTLTSTTVTLTKDGLYVWTIPGAGLWKARSINGSLPLYYVRFYPALTSLTAGTTIEGLVAVNKGTDYAYFPAGSTQELNIDEDLVGGLQFKAGSGTPTVYVNHIYYKG